MAQRRGVYAVGGDHGGAPLRDHTVHDGLHGDERCAVPGRERGHGRLLAGEVLVDLKSQRMYDLSARHRGGVASFSVAIPVDMSLCGMEMFVQGMCEDRHRGTLRAELTNAIDTVLGQ